MIVSRCIGSKNWKTNLAPQHGTDMDYNELEVFTVLKTSNSA